jgi:hypothetical protein
MKRCVGFEPQRRRERRVLWIVDDAFDAPPERPDVKCDEQAKLKSGRFQIRKNLRDVNGSNVLQRLELEHETVFDQ